MGEMEISPKYFLFGMGIGFVLFFTFVGINEKRHNDEVTVLGIQDKVTPTLEVEPTPTPTPTATPTDTPTPKPPLTPKPTPSSTPIPTSSVLPSAQPYDAISLVSKYAQEYGISEDVLFTIGQCESGFNPTSSNGPYGGIYQFHYSSWASIRNSMGLDANPDLRFNPEESIKTAAFKISRDGTGAWPACSSRL
jgi:hypothetical protein